MNVDFFIKTVQNFKFVYLKKKFFEMLISSGILKNLGLDCKAPSYCASGFAWNKCQNKQSIYNIHRRKHRKNCETALWAKKGFNERKAFFERKALLEKDFIERKALSKNIVNLNSWSKW